jgi:hypothetical protein
MHEPILADYNKQGTVANVSIPIEGLGTDATSNKALATMRDEILPNTLGLRGSIDDYGVAGITAESEDFNSKMKSAVPLVFAFVLTFAFLLMLVTFRSIVIAAKAIVMNLLSVAAAYGVVVLVFQHGFAKSLLDFDYTGGVVAFLPIFLFVILFGLSMDYHVFIISRIREGYDGGMKTEDAVAHGIKVTAGVVTSAAIVMVGVFAIFGSLPLIFLKQFGVGLAAAVLIDATIVRAVLLPATMKLLGDWNWYLPKWLEWLPRLEHEKRPRRGRRRRSCMRGSWPAGCRGPRTGAGVRSSGGCGRQWSRSRCSAALGSCRYRRRGRARLCGAAAIAPTGICGRPSCRVNYPGRRRTSQVRPSRSSTVFGAASIIAPRSSRSWATIPASSR